MRHILAAFLVTAGALAGCSRAAPQPSHPLPASRWLLTSFTGADGRHPVPTDPVPYLEVDEESLYFHNGCNGVGSTMHIEDGQLAVEMSVIRGVGCDPRFDAAEALLDAVADSMAGWSAYTVQGDEVVMSGGRFHEIEPLLDADFFQPSPTTALAPTGASKSGCRWKGMVAKGLSRHVATIYNADATRRPPATSSPSAPRPSSLSRSWCIPLQKAGCTFWEKERAAHRCIPLSGVVTEDSGLHLLVKRTCDAPVHPTFWSGH